MLSPIIAFFTPGPMEMMVVGVIALLLFGKRLPEVARSLGKGLVEFKRGISGIEQEVDHATYSTNESSSSTRPVPEEESAAEETTAPKFEPPAFEPRDKNTDEGSKD